MKALTFSQAPSPKLILFRLTLRHGEKLRPAGGSGIGATRGPALGDRPDGKSITSHLRQLLSRNHTGM
jgi:hypothetical protein